MSLFSYATYSTKRNTDGTYKIIRKHTICENGDPWVEIESIKADEDGIKMLPKGAILVKCEGTMTLYATEKVDETPCFFGYGELCKFLDGILEYHSFGDVFLFKTVKGWFFFFYISEFWNISKDWVMKERLESITKLCDADTQVLECKVFPITEHFTGYMVITSKGKFLLYREYGSVIGGISAQFVPFKRFSRIPGYKDLIKIYPNAGRRFFLARLSSCYLTCCGYKPEMMKKVTYLGEGYLLAEYGQKSKLFFCPDERYPTTVIDWGIHSITKVESHYYEEYIDKYLCTTWLVDDGNSKRTVESKFQVYCDTKLPKLK